MESRCVPVSCGAVESACRPSVALAMNSVYRVRSSCKRKSDSLKISSVLSLTVNNLT